MSADVLADIEDTGPVEAWPAYNAGAVVEQRICELGRLSVGRTAATPFRGTSPRSPTSFFTSCARTASAAAGAPCSRAESGCACCAPLPGSPPTSAEPRSSSRVANPPSALLRRTLRTIGTGLPARARLNGPGPGLPEAPRRGAHSPCLREPLGTPPEPRRPSAETRRDPENLNARATSLQPPVIIAPPAARLCANAGSGV